MKTIFERGYFHTYSIEERYFSAVESRTNVLLENRVTSTKTKVFLSHKHDDLADLKDLIGFFEKQYNVDTYIDSMDKSMPSKPCCETAARIKGVITSCDKFILLATDKAVESTWCNWELGYGDAKKFRKHIAILPMKEKDTHVYKGHEYMSIYPTIAYYDSSDIYSDGTSIKAGFYYCYTGNDGNKYIIPLGDWLKQRG